MRRLIRKVLNPKECLGGIGILLLMTFLICALNVDYLGAYAVAEWRVALCGLGVEVALR